MPTSNNVSNFELCFRHQFVCRRRTLAKTGRRLLVLMLCFTLPRRLHLLMHDVAISLNSSHMSEKTSFFDRTRSFDTVERLYDVGTVKEVSYTPTYGNNAPRIGLVASATVKFHTKVFAKPSSILIARWPNIWIEEPLAACRLRVERRVSTVLRVWRLHHCL